jgi:hypothetical protein
VHKRVESWRSYEDAVRAIIDRHKDLFSLEKVETSSKKIPGVSGYTWNIEVVGYTKQERNLVLFECRRRITRNIEPEEAGGFAYRIENIGAEKGYFVTPLQKGLSKGAKRIADYEKIGHIKISVDSTPEAYLMGYLNEIYLKIKSEQVNLTEHVEVRINPPAPKEG